jgi:hypothetical protein
LTFYEILDSPARELHAILQLPEREDVMNEKLDAILRTLEEAQRQIADARTNKSQPPDSVKTLTDAEAELNEIKEKLHKLRGP